MIHNAMVEVTCDGKSCNYSMWVKPDFVYPDYSGKNGYYDTSDSSIEKKLVSDDWIVEDSKHYCCEDCEEAR